MRRVNATACVGPEHVNEMPLRNAVKRFAGMLVIRHTLQRGRREENPSGSREGEDAAESRVKFGTLQMEWLSRSVALSETLIPVF